MTGRARPCDARADVLIGRAGRPCAGVPVTYLLYLEKQVSGVLAFFRALQTRDPAGDWVRHESDPGQAEAVPDEKRTGKWEITRFSGAVSLDRKTRLVENAEALLAAIRQARERAKHVVAGRGQHRRPGVCLPARLGWRKRGTGQVLAARFSPVLRL